MELSFSRGTCAELRGVECHVTTVGRNSDARAGEADLWFVFSDDLAPKMAAALACDGSLQVLTRCGSRSACPYRYRYRFFTPE